MPLTSFALPGFALYVVLTFAGVAPEPMGQEGPQWDHQALAPLVDSFFEREMAELGVPGVAFAMVAGGELVLLRGYGFADVEARTPMDAQRSVVRVGSVSKTVTALAALQLVERGDIDLHANIDVVLGDDLVADTFRPPVTLFHLLSQTAGFGERLFGQHAATPQGHLPLHTFLERHLTPRLRPPGLVINYNDYQTSLAGLMVETVTQIPFADAATTLVFEPLGMSSSSFEQVTLPAAMEPRLALAYRDRGRVALARDYVHTTPAAGLYTTAEDMGRLLSALLTEGAGVLAADAVRAMQAPQFRHGPARTGRGFGLAEGRSHGYRTLHKDGQCSGFTARLLLVPELGVGWFSVQNLSIFGRAGTIGQVNGLHRRLATELLEELWPEGPDLDEPTLVVAATPDPEIASSLAGTYRDTMDPTEGWEGLLLANEVRVQARHDGALQFLGLEPWRQIDPATFVYQEDGATAFAHFVEADTGSQRWVTFRAGAWERLPWYRTARATRAIGAASAAALVLGLATLLWVRRRSTRPLPRGAGLLASAAGLLLLFALGLGGAMLTTDVQLLYSGVTPWLRLVFLLPPTSLLLTVLGLARLAREIRAPSQQPGPSPLGVACCTLIALAALSIDLMLALHHALSWPL